MSFRFRIPTGQTEDLDDPGPIVERVRTAGAEFWNLGSGDAAVEKGSPYSPLMLELYFDRRDRFQVRYTPPGGWSLTAQDPEHGGSEAVIRTGGTPMTLAAGTLLTREAVEQIVRHFCDTGEKHPDYEWR
jgi:immunity protein Imm1 of predicted polymorphic toxin system